MNNNDKIINLRKSLDSIYEDFSKRIDENAWKDVVKPAYETDKTETSIIVIDFLQSHRYMPASCFKMLCNTINLKEFPSEMANIFTEKILKQFFEDTVNRSPIGYEHIPLDCTEEQIRKIVDTSRQLRNLTEKSQPYLAGLKLENLKHLLPEHPDVIDMENDVQSICSGIVPRLKKLLNDYNAKIAYNLSYRESKEKASAYEAESGINLAVSYYEKLMAENPDLAFVPFELGKLCLKKGEYSRALHLSDLLFERFYDSVSAYMLRGLILEDKGRYEDALLYYNLAYEHNPFAEDVNESRRRVFIKLDKAEPDDFFECERFEDEDISYEALDYEEDVYNTLDSIDKMILRGRLSQAYYEIRRIASNNSKYGILTFLKAFILYMLNKEKEARDIFKELSKSKIFGEAAVYIIDDIDRKIVDSGIFDGISEEEKAAIYFNVGMFDKAFNALSVIPMGEMSAEALVIRGRCEIYAGRMDSAYSSFEKALVKDPDVDNVQELMGMICQAKGELERALDHYNRSILSNINNMASCVLKAKILFDTKRFDELIDFYKELTEAGIKPSDTDGFIGMLYIEDSFNQHRKGAVCLQRALASGSDILEFYIALINLFINNEMYYAALSFTEVGFFNLNRASELFMKKVEILFIMKKYRAAELITGMLLTEHPDSAELQYIRGMIYSERNNDKEAIKWLKNASEADPNSHKYAYALADKCFEINDTKTAFKFYTRALELDENDSISLKRRALINKFSGREDDAVKDIEKALHLNPKDPEIYMIIGDLLTGYVIENVSNNVEKSDANEFSENISEKSENTDEVEITKESETDEADDTEKKTDSKKRPSILDDFEKDSEYYFSKAIEIDPEYRQGYMTRARYYAECGEMEKAFADIDKALELSDDKDADVYMVRGIIYQLSGKNDEAVADFRKAVSSEFMVQQAYSYISKCLNSMGRYTEALEAADSGLKIDENFMNLYLNRGVANYYSDNYEDAVNDFKKVLSKRHEVEIATVEGAYRFRGLAYERLGKYEDAIHDYRMLLRYDSGHYDIRENLENLEHKLSESKQKSRFSIFGRKNKNR